MTPRVSLIIPTFNEEKVILNRIKNWITYFKHINLSFEIIIADDGSTDNTRSIIINFITLSGLNDIKLISLDRNTGKGAILKLGIRNAMGEYTILSDADYPYDPFLMDWVETSLKSDDSKILIGDRTFNKSTYFDSKKRRFIGNIFFFIKRYLINEGIS